MEGSIIGWVANHRRHHVFSDRPGDPHSPHEFDGTGFAGPLRGFFHAHIGWLFKVNATSAKRFAPDLVRDTDVAIISRLFPLFAVFSLAAPFFLGWAWSGTIGGALTALLWAGAARMMLLHHVTWSVNSICHMFGSQPATDKDHSTNFAPLGVVSFGEAWHNFHHAHPRSARHGALPHQIDPSAAMIRLFERAGWATEVRWPTRVQIEACRTDRLVTTRNRRACQRRADLRSCAHNRCATQSQGGRMATEIAGPGGAVESKGLKDRRARPRVGDRHRRRVDRAGLQHRRDARLRHLLRRAQGTGGHVDRVPPDGVHRGRRSST